MEVSASAGQAPQCIPIAADLSQFFWAVRNAEFSPYAMQRIGKILWDIATVASVCTVV